MRIALLLLLAALVSCQSTDPQISSVAQAYLQARLQQQFDLAQGMVTTSSLPHLEELGILSRELSTPEEPSLSFEIVDVKQMQDSAAVTYLLEAGTEVVLQLNKQASDWRVVLNEWEVPDAALLILERKTLESEPEPSYEDKVLEQLLQEEEEEGILIDSL